MPGIFGIINKTVGLVTEKRLLRNIELIRHEDWLSAKYEIRHIMDKEIALGHISNGILNTKQPAVSDDILVFIDGELYDVDKLLNPKECMNRSNDADVILKLYKDDKLNFINYINGSFSALILDIKENKLILFNDRFGTRPLYYFYDSKSFIFGPELKFILTWPDIEKDLDFEAITEYFRFQFILNDKTFFKKISLFPYASILELDINRNNLEIKKYWDFDKIKPISNISFDESVEETSRLLRESVNKRLLGEHRFGVFISGGIDSRYIAGEVSRYEDIKPVNTITYGIKNCRDQKYAEQIAEQINSKHHFFDFENGSWVQEYSDIHTKLTESNHCCFHSHGISTLKEVRHLIDINMSGILPMGGFFLLPNSKHTDFYNLTLELYNYYIKNSGLTYSTETERYFLFTERKNIQEIDTFIDVAKKVYNKYPACFSDYFFIVLRTRRNLQYHQVFSRSYIENRSPYMDYSLLDFILALPVEYRLNKKLSIAVLNRDYPLLCMIPYQMSARLLTDNLFKKKFFSGKQIIKEKIGTKLGLYKPFVKQYFDYGIWSRTILKDWILSTLCDERLNNRGIFNSNYINAILESHFSGKSDHTWKIGTLVSFELMLRQLVDN